MREEKSKVKCSKGRTSLFAKLSSVGVSVTVTAQGALALIGFVKSYAGRDSLCLWTLCNTLSLRTPQIPGSFGTTLLQDLRSHHISLTSTQPCG